MKFRELGAAARTDLGLTSQQFVSIRGYHSLLPMITLPYSLIIEATEDPDFFGFYSADLDGFTGIGHSIEDCLYKARWGMADHIKLLRKQGLPVPSPNPNPTIVIQNTSKLQPA
ncbi:MAG TPA: type II toxin-antitoxin system HicB family antitoxin [Methylomirabilota bacterium]|jgi:predicted RNase H-like HicB family nuclease|nr:type II toxin-antitoxin system HicB family antitoxin [Methylomirabilota bacterium]